MAAMTDFIGVRELGLVAGGGILLCVLSTVVVLPPIILLVDRRWPLVELPGILPAGRWFRVSAPLAATDDGESAHRRRRSSPAAARTCGTTIICSICSRGTWKAPISSGSFSRGWTTASGSASASALRARSCGRERRRSSSCRIVAKTEEIASLLPDPRPLRRRARSISAASFAACPIGRIRPLPSICARLKQEIDRGRELLARETPYETAATARLAQLQERPWRRCRRNRRRHDSRKDKRPCLRGPPRSSRRCERSPTRCRRGWTICQRS